MRLPNPFKPTAGARPPELVGRRVVLDDFMTGLTDGPGAPGRLSLFTGARGVGKTVMLAEVSERARREGWVSLDVTATPGLLGRLRGRALDALASLDTATVPPRALTGLSIGSIGGVDFADPAPAREPDLRAALEALLEPLESRGVGLLVAVDEVHRKGTGDLRELAATYQHLTREDRDVALVLAGLPSSVNDLLNDDVLTFLRRADRQRLADVPLDEVSEAFEDSVRSSGRTIRQDALAAATAATAGYPFLIQLVGYHVWRSAPTELIDIQAARVGIAAARLRLGSTVHEATLSDLSAVDRTYLIAMAQDAGPSQTRDIAQRLGRSLQYQSVYRERLIVAGVIEPAGHGRVDFAVPYLREHLQEHAARYALPEIG